jgi:hypothetical protein
MIPIQTIVRVPLAAFVLAQALSVHGQTHDHSTPPTTAGHDHEMPGLYGPYPMAREASGTSWQPEAAGMGGVHKMKGPWMLMVHGFAGAVYDHQGGLRGDEKLFSPNMAMLMAQRPLGGGTLGLRSMVSLEPATIGKRGYPLIGQTGETADGVTPLVDRQHPHDLFMELSASYSVTLGEKSSAFVYAALPGEPALGPPAFMHRASGAELPESPLSHHWLDATHITFGVTTVGLVWNRLKVEGSAFRGQEPDQDRWDIETPQLDSWSGRLTFNPTTSWSLQASHGHLSEPELLEPGVDIVRTTLSASYSSRRESLAWHATAAWGRNAKEPGHTLDAFLAEGTLQAGKGGRQTLFARFESLEEDELLHHDESGPHGPGDVFQVQKLSVGAIHDLARAGGAVVGIGLVASQSWFPPGLQESYGGDPRSFMAFVRARLD